MYKKNRLIALLIVLIFLLASCGSPVDTGGTSSGESILRVGWSSEPDILNPITSYSTESMQATYLIYETLLGYGTDMETVYKLAESYEVSEDGKVFTYHLRENAYWQDGEKFTSADVVDSYTRIRDYQLGDASMYTEFLETITAPDDYTVVLEFSQPQAYNIAYVLLVLPEHIWGGMSPEEIEAFPNDNPIGLGAYKFVEWKHGSTLTLERNEDYYGEQPGADKIIFIVYANEDVEVQALKAGEIDILTEVSPTLWDSLKGEANIEAVSLTSFSFHYVGINSYTNPNSLGNKMLLDTRVRQAIGYALDREQMVNVALAGHGAVGASILPNAFHDWKYDFPADQQINNDKAKANQILDEAGYIDTDGDGIREKDGEPMKFRIFADEGMVVDVRAAQMVRDSVKEIGIELILTTMDENTMGGIVYNEAAPDFDMFVWGWDSDYPDPSYLLSMPLTEQIGTNNEVYYSNPEYDELYSLQGIQMNTAERKETINKLEKILYNDCSAQILWYQNKLQAYRTDKFTGWKNADGGVIFGITYENYLKVQPVK